MKLINEFTVDAPLDDAWAVLTDIPTVVRCVPGAELDRRDGADYHAHVTVKVGPIGMTLAGKATLVSQDDSAREMVVSGTAADRKGNGSTEATVRLVAREQAGRYGRHRHHRPRTQRPHRAIRQGRRSCR